MSPRVRSFKLYFRPVEVVFLLERFNDPAIHLTANNSNRLPYEIIHAFDRTSGRRNDQHDAARDNNHRLRG
jgi:hypothetical protein